MDKISQVLSNHLSFAIFLEDFHPVASSSWCKRIQKGSILKPSSWLRKSSPGVRLIWASEILKQWNAGCLSVDLANGHFHSIDRAAKPLKLSPHESEFASPWATIPGHSGPRHPGILARVAVGNFCLQVSAFHFRLTHKPKPQGYMAGHMLVRAVTCSCVLPIKIWFSGLQELLPELGVFEKGQACPTAGIVRLQPCQGEFTGLPLKLTAWVKFGLLSLSFLSNTDWLCFPCSWLSVRDTKIGRVHFHYLRVRQRDA